MDIKERLELYVMLRNNKSKAVYAQYGSTRRYFESLIDASWKSNMSVDSIKKHISSKIRDKFGYKWGYLEELSNLIGDPTK